MAGELRVKGGEELSKPVDRLGFEVAAIQS
jgi:hypothetical protein